MNVWRRDRRKGLVEDKSPSWSSDRVKFATARAAGPREPGWNAAAAEKHDDNSIGINLQTTIKQTGVCIVLYV